MTHTHTHIHTHTIAGTATKHISSGDSNWCVNCKYFVGVYGLQETQFEITARMTSDSIELELEKPQPSEQVQPQLYEYYHIHIESSNAPALSIYATTFCECKIQMFVGNGTKYPTLSDSTWKSESSNQPSIFIKKPQPGIYRIGVLGQGTSVSEYSIEATLGRIYLVESVPQIVSFTYNELQNGIRYAFDVAYDASSLVEMSHFAFFCLFFFLVFGVFLRLIFCYLFVYVCGYVCLGEA